MTQVGCQSGDCPCIGRTPASQEAAAPQSLVPFVHKICTRQHRYLFDVNTSRMLRVSPAVWDIVEDVGVLAKPDLIARYSDRYPASVLAEAYDTILATQAKGLFSANRPREILSPYTEEMVAGLLAGGRTSVTLVVTEQCNFRCSYCVYGGSYAHYRTHSPTMMSWDTARQAIDEFLAHSSPSVPDRTIRFYGGEPLLALPLMKRCVEYVRQERKQTDIGFVTTINGSLLRGEAADFLAQNEFYFRVSLDGPEHIHDRCRRLIDGSGSWRLVMDNVGGFLDKYPRFKSSGRLGFHAVVVPPTNLLELEEFCGSCDLFHSGMTFSVAYVSPLDTTFMSCIPPGQRKIEGYEALHDKYFNNLRDGALSKDYGRPALWVQRSLFEKSVLQFYKRGYASAEHPLLPERLCPSSMCMPGIRRLYVKTDGSYYPCERVQETEVFCIGNVRDGVSATKISDLLRGFVDLAKDECRSCWCVATCQAGCVVTVMQDGKMDAAARKRVCESYRASTHRLMTDVCEVLEANPNALQYGDAVVFK